MDLFCAKFNLSYECSASLHSLVKVLLPTENRLPSGYSHVQSMNRNYEEKVRAIRKTSAASFCVLSFRFQIRDIVKSQLSNILRYSNQRKEDPFGDFSRSICPIVEVGSSENLLINLILFSDGVNIKKSTFKKEVWPIWIQIADLPPKLRMARKNFVLAALFVGETVPNWTQIVPHLRSEIFSGIDLSIDEQTNYKLSFKMRLLISDLGAKNHMLNMFKFNGFYGRHFCETKGKTVGKTHAYYPFIETGRVRESHLTENYVNMAEAQNADELPNVVGVKGRSPFSEFIAGLPLTAPVDYMRCVLLGAFP